MSETWLTLVVVGVVTFAYRFSCIGFAAHFAWLERGKAALRFVPAAAFAALVASELFVRGGAPSLEPRDPRLLAALLATAVAWRTRSVLATIATGMLAVYLLRLL